MSDGAALFLTLAFFVFVAAVLATVAAVIAKVVRGRVPDLLFALTAMLVVAALLLTLIMFAPWELLT
jgi:hypothetical protein